MTMTDTPTLIRCNDCAELVPPAMVALTSPAVVCEPCRHAAYVLCSACSTWVLTGDASTIGTQSVCERCWERS